MGLGSSGADWFESSLKGGIRAPNTASTVVAFVNPEEFFVDVRTEVEATGPGHFIYWIGFEIDGGKLDKNPYEYADAYMPETAPSRDQKRPFSRRDFQKGDKKWYDLLKEAHGRKVQIRALLTLHPSPKDDNGEHYKRYNFNFVKRFNDELPDAFAINDFRYLWLNGVHHQKLLLVFNDKGLIAYLGTCDIQRDRLYNRWCEVVCKYQGQTARQLQELFVERWSEHTAVLKKAGKRGVLKPLTKPTNPSQSDRFIHQVSRTFGNPNRASYASLIGGNPDHQFVNRAHAVKLARSFAVGEKFFTGQDPEAVAYLNDARQQADSYAFAANGQTGIYWQIKKAIENTEKFIYMEDQYLVCDEKMGSLDPILTSLVKKVKEKSFKNLIILCTRIDEINSDFQFTGWAHRRNFIKQLLDAGKEKVIVCQYRSNADLVTKLDPSYNSPFYVHSKTWFFDDELLICGSANCNRRGYSHDSELNGAVYDIQNFVKDLRMRVWQARLNTEGARDQKFDLADFCSAAKYWESPASWGLTIETCGQDVDRFKPTKWPDRSLTEKDILQYVPTIAAGRWLRGVIKQYGIWHLAVDPDGTQIV